MDSFIEATPLIATGSQPSAKEIQLLAKQEYQVIINLGLTDTDYALDDEAGLTSKNGMHYHHLPIPFEQPDENLFAIFCKIMQQHKSDKVFVHCAANKRATVFVSLYGQKELCWTEQEANTFINNRWQPNDIWLRFIADIRNQPI